MRYMLRYGMSVILLVLFAFMGYVLNAIEIDNKVTVDVIMEHDGNLYSYVPNGVTMGKHVVVQTTDGKNLSFLSKDSKSIKIIRFMFLNLILLCNFPTKVIEKLVEL